MKKMGRIIRSFICGLSILFSSSGLYAATWIAGSTPSVVDDNLVIDASGGDIALQGLEPCNGTNIYADTTDITVTVTGGNAIVTGNASGQTILRIKANAGRTITFDLTGIDTLTFKGATDAGLSSLLILQEEFNSQVGTVRFLFAGGNSLTLTSDLTHGPVEFYQRLYTTAPTLRFERAPINPADEVYITIGARSILSFTSLDGLVNTTNGIIVFDPTNTGNGRFVLEVEDTGAFTMAVHQAVLGQFVGAVCSVNRNIPAGGFCSTVITNSGGPTADAALMINNYNATYAEYLIDPYGNQGATADSTNYSGSFNGLRYGVSAGANHILNIEANAYLDYVGLANNTCPTPDSLPGIVDPNAPLSCPCGPGVNQFLKSRNYSALTIDGWYNPNSVPSAINLGVQSGIYFRSGVDANGNVNNDFLENPFTIDPVLITPGAGEYVFDVEARLFINGSNIGTTTLNSRLEILSLEVAPLSGPLFPVEGNPLNTQFLARTFATDGNDKFFQYNKGAWLINDRVDLISTALAHTDENHLVCQNNDVISEPTYVGGEKWLLSELRDATGYPFNYCINPSCPLLLRPEIAFINSLLQVQTSIAVTGVDLWAPTYIVGGTTVNPNDSEFRFYSNGYLVDNGTGRSMILGTLIGSQACDGCTIISDDAHLNIIQDQNYSIISVAPTQQISLTDSQNNSLVNNQIIDPITGQTSVEAIYLGHNSNISIGTNDSSTGFVNNTENALLIAGNFFHFGTRGGSLGIPSTSSVTGQGGIFVDLNGMFAILPDFIASMDVMVTKSQNGIVDLPPSQVFFSDQVGITDWQQDLSVNQVIVPTDQYFSDYTLNWLTVTKSPEFFPYLISDINVCNCPPFTTANLTAIPTVQGQVDQLQIVNSRIGDPAHILIAGGWVREVLWLSDCRAGEAPVAVIVMQDNGRLGLNNAHRNPDSVFTQTVLGANGINIVANGNARIDLNDDVIINNICSIIQGPDFTPSDVIEFLADTPYTIHVTKDGILDLSNFTVAGTIRFGGNVRVNFEPGSRLILGAADLEFSDNAIVEIESAYELQLRISALDNFAGPIDNTVDPLVSVDYTVPNNVYSPLTDYGVGLLNTDPYRVRVMGIGVMRFTDNASLLVNTNGILSVESLFETLPNDVICEIPTTSVTLQLTEAAQFNIGKGNNILGGVFQIGDVSPEFGESPRAVNFTLTIDGADAVFTLGSGGFFGLGAGVVRPNQGANDNQSNVLADTLFNVDQITLELFAGELSHNRIFSSDDVRSASMVIGLANNILVDFDNATDLEQLNAEDYLTSGGGNFFLLVPGDGEPINEGAMRLYNPEDADDNIINAPFGATTVPLVRMRGGILASLELLDEDFDPSGLPLPLFLALKTGDATNAFGPAFGLADAAPLSPDRFRQERENGLLGYVDRAVIGRQEFQDIIDAEGGTGGERRNRAYDLGAVRVQVDTSVPAPGPVTLINQIRT